MSKQRYISTSFWEDEWVESLEPMAKLIYLYLLTNPLTNIAGVYKITSRRISFDTCTPEDQVNTVLHEFHDAGKACRYGEYIILPSWPRHQQWSKRQRIRAGIDLIICDLPEDVQDYMVSIGYQYHIKGYAYESNYSDSDLDPDRDSDSSSPRNPVVLESSGSPDGPPLDDEVSDFLKKERAQAACVPYKEIIEYFNGACKTKYSYKSNYLRLLLKARWNDGARMDDFKAVIDLKAKQWGGNPKMVKYLRPITIFAPSKFDSYLNEVDQNRQLSDAICKECGIGGGMHAESCPVLGGSKKKPSYDDNEIPF